MRIGRLACFLALLTSPSFGQSPAQTPTFDVASVKRSDTIVGPDANNRFTFAPSGITARHATLRRLIAEAYHLQLRQVLGPGWLDESEYDIEAKASGPAAKEQLALMLRTLLADRFRLQQHRETRQLRAYELVAGTGGPKVHPVSDGEAPPEAPGMRFHGDMRHLADLISIQLTIQISDDPGRPGRAGGAPVPVLDKTGLPGIYDFAVDIRPEPGSDMLALWQRILRDQLGLKLENRRGEVDVLVVDSAERVPTGN